MGKASLVFNLPVPLLLPPDMKCLFVFFFFSARSPASTRESRQTKALLKDSKVSGLWPLMNRRCSSIAVH